VKTRRTRAGKRLDQLRRAVENTLHPPTPFVGRRLEGRRGQGRTGVPADPPALSHAESPTMLLPVRDVSAITRDAGGVSRKWPFNRAVDYCTMLRC
jgi:hypothetical protein